MSHHNTGRLVDGMLVLYHFRPPYAATVLDHVRSFARHSRFPVWTVNTEESFPDPLLRHRFRILLLHYSLFGSSHYMLDDRFRDYIAASEPELKIAFFQDEYYYCGQRFRFIDDFAIDWVYTLLRPAEAHLVYGRRTHGPRLLATIPGYVGENLLEMARRFARPPHLRPIDVGYRARSLPYYMGRGAQEKADIGRQFARRTSGLPLRLDIKTDEGDRLYGPDWYKFLGSCRAVLGVEAGVSIFDLDDEVRPAVEALLRDDPSLTFQEVFDRVLSPWEDNVYYRTISPRHFEAAAFETCQVLFEGSYSGLLEPDVHYLALRKDFTNLDDVVAGLGDPDRVATVASNARRDLIDSGRFTYEAFVRAFDAELESAGFSPPTAGRNALVDRDLARGALRRRFRAHIRSRYREWRDRGGRR